MYKISKIVFWWLMGWRVFKLQKNEWSVTKYTSILYIYFPILWQKIFYISLILLLQKYCNGTSQKSKVHKAPICFEWYELTKKKAIKAAYDIL